jgi:hypothetical protein
VPCPSHSFLFHHKNNIRSVQIIMLLFQKRKCI